MTNFSKTVILAFAFSICVTASGQVYQQQIPAQQYQQPVYQQPTYQQPINQQPIVQQPINQQPVYQQPVYQQQNGQFPNQQLSGTVVQNTGQSVLQTSGQTNLHWTQKFTKDTNHDFGAVAKASTQEHIFEFVNNLDTNLHLMGVQASCGCTIPTILTPTVKPGEVAKLKAKFDTLNHEGHRAATLRVSVRKDSPYVEYGEVQFAVKGQIRRDVVLTPGIVEFTELLKGKEAQRTLTLQYAGSPQWMIREVKSSNPNVTIEYKETLRDQNARRVSYELVVKVDGEQKEGQFTDNLTIVTNDRTHERISVDVNGRILSVIETSDIQLGVLNKNQRIEKSLIIRGARPFRISDIRANNPAIKILEHEGEKTLHIVKYELDTSKAQKIEDMIEIYTTDPLQEKATVNFSAQIVPGTFASDE